LQYIVYGLILLVLFFLIIYYLRKLHWDVIHSNLLDLVDEFEGNVHRKGFLSRPVFHGNYKNCEITINFSQERIKSARKNYINISINKKLNKSITIASLDWIKSQNESTDGLETILMNDSNQYGIRINKIKETLKNDLKHQLEKIVPFNYLFIGQTGLIYEKESKNLGTDTKSDLLKSDITHIFNLSNLFE
jgi:hypothetical protein